MITFSDQAVLRFFAEWYSSAQASLWLLTDTDYRTILLLFYRRPALSKLRTVRHCFDAGAGVDKIDYVYMDISDLIIYLFLNKTTLWLRCLHELLLEYSIHVPVLHVIVHRSINGTSLHHHVTPSDVQTYSSSSLWCHIQFWVFHF